MHGASNGLRLFNLQFACLHVEHHFSLRNDGEVESHFWSSCGLLFLSYFSILLFHVKFGDSAPLEFIVDLWVGFSEGVIGIAFILAVRVGITVAIFFALPVPDFRQVLFESSSSLFRRWFSRARHCRSECRPVTRSSITLSSIKSFRFQRILFSTDVDLVHSFRLH